MVISVTNLGYFWKLTLANFLAKEAHIFGNFLGSSENWYCYYLGHFRKNWSIFIPPSDHTDADGGIHKRGGIIVSSQFWQVEYTKLIFLPTQSKQLSHLKRSGLVSSYILLMFELITCIYSTFCVHMPVIYSMNSTIYVHILQYFPLYRTWRKGGGIAMVMLRYDRNSCMNPYMDHKEPKKPALYARMLDPVWITATSRAESSPFAVDSHFLLSLIVVVVFYMPSLF